MSTRSRELREKRAALAKQMSDLIPATGGISAQVQEQFNRLDTEQEGLRREVETIERAETLDAELRQTTRPPQPVTGATDRQADAADAERYNRAFRNYLRHGLFPDQYGSRGISEEDRSVLFEHRDMGTGGGGAGIPGTTGGGYFVPVGFIQQIEEALKYYGDMLRVATIMDTATGQPLPHPTDNDTTVMGEIIGENQSVTSADVTIGQIMLGAFKFSSKMVKVSIEMLQDSAFAIEPWLADKFGLRIGRILNNKTTVGAGTTEPTGILTAATASGQVVIGDDNATTPDPTQQVGYLDLLNLEHSVDILYRRGSKYMMHDTSLRFVKGLKDKYGRPLWLPGIATNSPDTILGYQFSINNDMAVLAPSAKTVAFGRLDKYLIRRVKEFAILRLVERYAEYGQVAFIGFARYDGNLLDAGTHPVKYLVQHS
jgi:HK97 family phage major capsid protein